MPPAWPETSGEEMLRHYNHLSVRRQLRVRQVAEVLLAEKDWVGGSGFEVTEEIKVTVAGMAAILVLGLEEPYFFDEVRSIIIYPGPYVDPAAYRRQDAIVGEGYPRLGEAWYHGPIVLSWREVLFWAAETRATATMSFSMNSPIMSMPWTATWMGHRP